jgi:hypothetical protein
MVHPSRASTVDSCYSAITSTYSHGDGREEMEHFGNLDLFFYCFYKFWLQNVEGRTVEFQLHQNSVPKSQLVMDQKGCTNYHSLSFSVFFWMFYKEHFTCHILQFGLELSKNLCCHFISIHIWVFFYFCFLFNL